MDSRDSKVYKKILKAINDNGPLRKIKALEMCAGESQLDRLLLNQSKLMLRYGYITTQEEIDNRIKGNPSGLLLYGHDTCGIGGIHRNV
jgi:hypothetical protein